MRINYVPNGRFVVKLYLVLLRKFTCATVETSTLWLSPENFRSVYLGNTKTPEVHLFKEPVNMCNIYYYYYHLITDNI